MLVGIGTVPGPSIRSDEGAGGACYRERSAASEADLLVGHYQQARASCGSSLRDGTVWSPDALTMFPPRLLKCHAPS